MSNLSAAPVNFQRFLDMQSASGRSLSPENEIRQMTVSTPSPGRFPEPGCELGATLGSQGASVAGRSPSRSLRYESHTGGWDGDPVSHGGTHSNGMHGRDPLEEARAIAASWQYGSPLYYPVTGEFCCWNAHPTAPKACESYRDVEGVSCDLCGFTVWLSGPAASGSSSVGVSVSLPVFQHCEQCGMDLCHHCVEDIRADVRFHVPCLWCDRCSAFDSLNADHICLPRAKVEAAAPVTVKPEPVKVEPADDDVPDAVVVTAVPAPAPALESALGASQKVEDEAEVVRAPSTVRQRETPDAEKARVTAKAEATAKRPARSRPQARAAAAAAFAQPQASGPTAKLEWPAAVAPPPPAALLAPVSMPSDVPPAPPAATAPLKRCHKSKAEQALRALRARMRLAAKLEKEAAAERTKREREAAGALRGCKQPRASRTATAVQASAPRQPAMRGTPPAGWQVRVAVDVDDADEVRRMADELSLDLYGGAPDVTGRATVVFVLPTRLRAEQCARRAHDAGLTTSLQKA